MMEERIYRLGDLGSPKRKAESMIYEWKGYSCQKVLEMLKENMKKFDEEGKIYYSKHLECHI